MVVNRFCFGLLFVAMSSGVRAQDSSPVGAASGSAAMPQTQQAPSMGGMRMGAPTVMGLQLPSPHQGSGTAWQPASVTGYQWMWMHGGWEFMAHGTIFIDYNQQGGPRGGG